MSRALQRALNILDCLAEADDGLRLSDLSRQLQAEPSNILRLLKILTSGGYVERDEAKRYTLGLKAVHLAGAVLRRWDLASSGQQMLRSLSQQTGEAAHLAALQGRHVVYLGRVESRAAVRVSNEVGQREPAHCTAVGKVLLAHLPPQEVRTLFPSGRLPSHTPHTLTTLKSLTAELQSIRERGYAVDREELNPGVCCISAPVRDHLGNVVASIGISAPAARLPEECVGQVAEMVREHARLLSEQLGCRKAA
jgi:DNA-binding IclR family transcriptional regulator